MKEKKKRIFKLKPEAENIETRPLWKPMHLQPVFKDAPFYGSGMSERLFDRTGRYGLKIKLVYY